MYTVLTEIKTNGIMGQPFLIKHVIFKDDIEVDEKAFRCQIDEEVEDDILVNVLPMLEDILETHSCLSDMLRDSDEWLDKHYPGSIIRYV